MSDRPGLFRGESVTNSARPVVEKAWTDYNDHFNVAYYVLAFDIAADAFFADMAFSRDRLDALGIRWRTTVSKVVYLREVHLGRELTMTSQVLSLTDGRVHLLQAMYVDADGYLAALEERQMVSTGKSSGSPRSTPDEILAALHQRHSIHADLSVPDGWGELVSQ